MSQHETPDSEGMPPVPEVVESKEIVVNSPEWRRLTERRSELIVKKNHGEGLDPAEAVEFHELQQRSLEIIDKAFPWPRIDPAEVAYLDRMLGSESDSPQS